MNITNPLRIATQTLIAIGAMLATAAAMAQNGPTVHRADAMTPVPFFVAGPDGGVIDPESADMMTPLYDRRSFDEMTSAGLPANPITAPDGHHVTWGEWSDVEGRTWVTCNGSGTKFTILLEDLIPNGVYTIWNVTFEAPGFQGFFDITEDLTATTDNLVGIGAAGPPDGRLSSFRASATGTAKVEITTPPGDLSVVGSLADCAPTGEFEWHLVGLYHSDGRTHGPILGPPGTMAEQFAFIFKQ